MPKCYDVIQSVLRQEVWKEITNKFISENCREDGTQKYSNLDRGERGVEEYLKE